MGAEEALLYIGGIGLWQMVTFCLVSMFFAMPSMWQLFAIVFEGFGYHIYNCDLSNIKQIANKTVKEIYGRNISEKYAPWTVHPLLGIPLQDSCKQYEFNSTYRNESLVPCRNGYTYAPSYFEEKVGTITMEWDLVCGDRQNFVEISQVIFTLGGMVGSLFFSPFNDMFGRKKVFFFCQLVMCMFGIAMAFARNFPAFCIFQFLTGAFTMGNDIAGFVLACEIFPAHLRSFMAPAIYLFVAVGMMFMVVFAYFIRNWRTLQLAVSLAPLLTMLYIWHCPESVRWLIANERFDEAKEILDSAAECNGMNPVPMELITEDELKEEDKGDKKPTMLQYVRRGKTLLFLVCMIYLMFANNLMYYGLNLMAQALPANLYLTFFILSVLEIPGTLVAIGLMLLFGRRFPLSFFNFFAGIFLMLGAIAFNIPLETFGGDQGYKDMVVTALTLTAKFGIAGSWSIELVYAQEIFPTNLRGAGAGLVGGLGMIGAVLAPVGVMFAKKDFTIPVAIFAGLALLAGFIALVEPETLGRPLPTTIEEIINWSWVVSKREKELYKEKENIAIEKRKQLQRMGRGYDAPVSAFDNKGFNQDGSQANMGTPAGYVPYQEKPRYSTGSHVNPAYTPEKDTTKL